MAKCGDCAHFLYPPDDFPGSPKGYCLECDDWCDEDLTACRAFEEVESE